MSDKFSFYQTEGLWGIIENASDEKQTSIKSYFGSDLLIKRLNEQADQIDQLKQQLEELMLLLSKYEIEEHKPVYCTLAGTECEYLGKVEELKQQLEEKDKLLKCYQEEEKLIADMLGDKDLTIIGSRVHLKNLIVELKNKIKDKDIVIEEKDKEIERLKVFEKAYYFNQTQVSQESIDLLLQNAYQVHNETQLAIKELEKVKIMAGDLLEKFCSSWEYHQKYMRGHRHIEYYDLIQGIDNQIKELKGE